MDKHKLKWVRFYVVIGIIILSSFSFFSYPQDSKFESLAQSGDPEIQYQAGRRYLERKYAKHFRCSGEAIFTWLCVGIERYVFFSDTVTSLDRAQFWLTKASEQNHDEATYLLAMLKIGEYTPYWEKEYIPETEPQASRYLLEQSAKNGHILSSYKLGWYYLRGVGGNENHGKALNLLSYAASKGNEKAQRLYEQALIEQANKSSNLTGAENAPPS